MSQGIDPKTHKPFINPIHDSNSHHGGNNHFLGNSDHLNVKMILSSEDDGDMIMNCCHHDSLSSFLNSLINDDMFDNQDQEPGLPTQSCINL